MIERIGTNITVGVDKATKKAADALERVTDRLAGRADNTVDRAVSIRLTSQYSENYLNAGNAQDSISYMQMRDGALGGVTDRLQRLRELAVQMGSPILNESDKDIMRQEAGMILEDIQSAADTSEFNTHKVIGDVSLSSLGLDGLNFGAEGTISAIDRALQTVSTKRTETGASISTMEARIDNLAQANVNLAGAIENRSGSFLEDIADLADSLNRLEVSLKAADVYLDIEKKKVSGLLELM